MASFLTLLGYILEDRLYFAGGEYTFQDEDTDATQPQLYWLDLNASFTVDNIISRNSLHSSTFLGPQWQNTGVFFVDANLTTMYTFDGVPGDAAPLGYVAAFNSTSETWRNISVNGDALDTHADYATSATTATSGLGLGFSPGGSGAGGTDPWMITFDTSNPESPSWTNQTNGVPRMLLSTMQYARFGEKGVLITFGGYIALNEAILNDMASIMVYDVASTTWFNVTATGDVPEDRSEFCSVISSSPDDSSFQILIYGGFNIHQVTALEDVYILSLPPFTWINITDQNNEEAASLGISFGRYGHTCNLYGERQMLVLGGNIRTTGAHGVIQNAGGCNQSYPAIRVLDVTTLTWQLQLETSTDPYAVPDPVWKVIGGSASGGANMSAPSGGFNNSTLAQIFNKTIPRYVAAITNSSTSSNTRNATFNAASKSPSPQSRPVGAIAGGVVGGIAAVAILGVLLYFLYFKGRRRGKAQQQEIDRKPELSAQHSIMRQREGVLQEADTQMAPREVHGRDIVEAPSGRSEGESLFHEMASQSD